MSTTTSFAPRATKATNGLGRAVCAASCLTVVAVVLWLLPGAPFVPTLCATALLTACMVAIGSRMQWWSPGAEIVIIISATLLAVGVIANVYYFTTTSSGTDSAPVLLNPDAARAWQDTMYYLGESTTRSPLNHGLIGMVFASVMFFTGPSVTAGLMVSLTMTLVTLMCAGALGYKLGQTRRAAWLSMVATACICYLMASGTILIKDATVIAGMALTAVALADIEGGSRRRAMIFMVSGSVLLSLSRPQMLILAAAGALIVAVASRRSRHAVGTALICALMAIVFLLVVKWLSNTPIYAVTNLSGSDFSFRFDAPQQAPYFALIGNYTDLAIYKRVLLLPASAAVQFFIPFPWNYMRDVIFGPTLAYAHVAYPWYVFGGVMLYYLFTGLKSVARRYRPFALWAAVIWLVPCWLYGGTVSRYMLPAVPLMAPVVVAVIANCWRHRRFRIFMGVYAGVVAVALIVCHHYQTLMQS